MDIGCCKFSYLQAVFHNNSQNLLYEFLLYMETTNQKSMPTLNSLIKNCSFPYEGSQKSSMNLKRIFLKLTSLKHFRDEHGLVKFCNERKQIFYNCTILQLSLCTSFVYVQSNVKNKRTLASGTNFK